MRWFAKLCNGDVIGEYDRPGDLSTWRLLMAKCEREGLWIEGLWLTVDGQTAYCKPKAIGYWQANMAVAMLGAAVAQDVAGLTAGLAAKAVGWVEGDRVFVLFGTADGKLHWGRDIPITGQRQIIWAPTAKTAHGGANERVVVQNGVTLLEADGSPVRLPSLREA